MQFGFIKVCAATVPIRVADVSFNMQNIIKAAKEAEQNGSQLTVFQELGLCGYTCGDLFQQNALLNQVDSALAEVCQQTAALKSLLFVGAPLRANGRLYNCAVAICNGKILGVVPKTAIPNYGEFYERRHFSPAPKSNSTISVAGQIVPFGKKLLFKAEEEPDLCVAAELCEDLWVPQSPSTSHAQAGATVIVNLSCSDEIVGKSEYRRDLIKMQSGKLLCGYIYTDSGDGESTTDMVFAGHSLIAENATILAESKLFENKLIYAEIDVNRLANERQRMASSFYAEDKFNDYAVISFHTTKKEGELTRTFSQLPFVPNNGVQLAERAELILSLQAKGLAKRLQHTNAKTAVIGVSGGLDSALALLVTNRAFQILGKESKNIIAITMPGFGTTGKTLNNSVKLIEQLGFECRRIPITDSVLQHFKDIGHDKESYDVTYENAQARTRTLILMDIANKTGGLVIGTGDLSELALGWSTYNGDHMSMYAVNSSVPKTLVQYLIEHEAERLGGDCQVILNDILHTEISPELLPPDKDGKIAQKTEDLVGPYILHDFFLYYAVRWGFAPEKVQYLAEVAFAGKFNKATIAKWLQNFYRRFFAQQFKRSCIPDGVKVGSVTLSPRGDWRMPSDAISTLWLNQITFPNK